MLKPKNIRYWLDSFAFSIDLKLWLFFGAGAAALLIAWLTVGLQTIRAARVNPVECLKAEYRSVFLTIELDHIHFDA